MIIGAHTLLYSRNADADRAFLRDVIGLKAVDIGHGWIIFGMPPSEAAVHPAEGDDAAASGAMTMAHVYLMCDDIEKTLADLAAKGVACPAPSNLRWGIVTQIPLPSGGQLGLYQPLHPTAI